MNPPRITGIGDPTNRSSAFVNVAWQGTRPTIPALIPTPHQELEGAFYVRNALSPEQKQEFSRWALAQRRSFFDDQVLLEWAKSRPEINVGLNFKTESYQMASLPLADRFPDVPFVSFATVPPTEIFGLNRNAPQFESVHHFFFLVSGSFFALGFHTEAEKNAFLQKFTERFSTEAGRKNFSSSHAFFPGGWRDAGSIVQDGNKLSLVLLTPPAYELVKQTSLFEAVPDDFFAHQPGEYVFSEPTRAGTVYVYNRSRDLLGLINENGVFRVNARLKSESEYNTASHAAILSRQIDPFGLGIVEDNSNAQFLQADRILSDVLKNEFNIYEGLLRADEPLKPVEEHVRVAGVRLASIANAHAAQHKLTSVAQSVTRIRQGIASWNENFEPAQKVRHLRFIWLTDAESDNALFAADANLLHYQIAKTVFSGSQFASGIREGGNGLAEKLRGGILKLIYDESGRLKNIELADDVMTLPGKKYDQGFVRKFSESEKNALMAILNEKVKSDRH